MKYKTMNAVRYLAVLVDRGHGKRKHAIQLPDNHVRPHRHALITSWIEQRNSQRLLQGACSLDLSRRKSRFPCPNENN